MGAHRTQLMDSEAFSARAYLAVKWLCLDWLGKAARRVIAFGTNAEAKPATDRVSRFAQGRAGQCGGVLRSQSFGCCNDYDLPQSDTADWPIFLRQERA